jgi:MFS family permease
VLLVTQTLAMAQAFGLAALALSGTVEVWHVVALNSLLGVVTAFDMTARQVFLTEMVTAREDTANAIALNSSLVNGARLIGPALAGFVLAHTSAGVCFLINGASYLAVVAVLLAMTVPHRVPPAARGRVWADLREGLAYAFGFAPIRSVILLLALMSVVGAAQTTLLPVIATKLPGGGADTYGLLAAASGVGALAAALFLATRMTVVGLGRWLAAAPAMFGLAVLGLSFAGSVYTASAALAFAGFAVMMHMAASNTILQTIADEAKRGRVMSLYTAAFFGAAPLGSLAAGALAEHVGLAQTLWLAAALGAVGSAVFAFRLPRLRELVRPIYVRLGILPEPGPAAPGTPVFVLPGNEK